MHPSGSIGILQAAAAGGGGRRGGGARPSFAFPLSLSPLLYCLAVMPTPLTPTNILKYRTTSPCWRLSYPLSLSLSLSEGAETSPSMYCCLDLRGLQPPAPPAPRYFPPPRWAGWTYLSIYQTD